jgi:hypothetical protein
VVETLINKIADLRAIKASGPRSPHTDIANDTTLVLFSSSIILSVELANVSFVLFSSSVILSVELANDTIVLFSSSVSLSAELAQSHDSMSLSGQIAYFVPVPSCPIPFIDRKFTEKIRQKKAAKNKVNKAG